MSEVRDLTKNTEYVLQYESKERPVQQAHFGAALVVGMGSTATTLIPLLERGFASEIHVETRESPSGKKVRDELRANGGVIESRAMSSQLERIAGKAQIDSFALGMHNVEKVPDSAFLCTPNQNYAENIKEMAEAGLLRPGQVIVGISTRVGSAAEIIKALSECGMNPDDFTVVSLGTYYAATKKIENMNCTANTRAIKQSIPVGFSVDNHQAKQAMYNMLATIDTRVDIQGNLEAELGNANTFVHAQYMSVPEVLGRVFNPEEKGFMYRVWPEGAATPETFMRMQKAETEINEVVKQLGGSPKNLLHILVNELYPVPEEQISQAEVEQYPYLSEGERALLLSAWFWGRQKDPFAQKDAVTGELPPHLSAVKLQTVTYNEGTSQWEVPRIPTEDYEALVLIKYIAEELRIPVPTIDYMVESFEEAVQQFSQGGTVNVNIDIEQVQQHMRDIAEVIIVQNKLT